MNKELLSVIDKLQNERSLALPEYEYLIEQYTEETARILAERAVAARRQIYGNAYISEDSLRSAISVKMIVCIAVSVGATRLVTDIA